MPADIAEGAACAPNMSTKARGLRVRVAYAAAVATILALVVTVALDAAWWVRWLAALVPALAAASAFFEARSNVCVLRAAEGTFEHDDRSRTPMEERVLPAIRRVAASVIGKSVAAGLTLSAVAMGVTLLF
jgi:hypothetical protein